MAIQFGGFDDEEDRDGVGLEPIGFVTPRVKWMTST
jgi:hypothetical protein